MPYAAGGLFAGAVTVGGLYALADRGLPADHGNGFLDPASRDDGRFVTAPPKGAAGRALDASTAAAALKRSAFADWLILFLKKLSFKKSKKNIQTHSKKKQILPRPSTSAG